MVNFTGGSWSKITHVAAARDRSYLDCWFHPETRNARDCVHGQLSRPLLVLAFICGLIVAATLALWAYYGTAVFLEIVRAGWVACF